MNGKIRGAASVSVVWVIVLFVVLLGLGGALYAVAADRAQKEIDLAQARAATEAATAKTAAANAKVASLSKWVGYRDENDPLSESNADQIGNAIKQIQENHGKDGVGPDATTLTRIIDRLSTRIDDLNRELGEARQQSSAAQKDRESINAQLADMTRQKDEAYAALQKQLTDERDRNASQESADKTRIDELNRRLTDQDTRFKGEKEELEKQITALQGDVRTHEGRVTALAKQFEYIRLPDEPDGSVVQVSNGDKCYVDLGTEDLLRRGTRFKVFTYGKGGAMREKGMIEITRVDKSMSEATIVELADRFDPITKGDRIAAPNYDPDMPREFVLVGRFPTGYSRAMVADRLKQLGAKVADKVGPTTDFLVLGDRDDAAAGGEEGGDVEEPTAEDSADSEDIKLAQLYRVQILPVREILEFLKYE